MSEETLFNEGDVWVTNKRFISGAQTVAVGGITAVETKTESSLPVVPLVLILFGAFGVLIGFLGLLGGSGSEKYTATVVGVFGGCAIAFGIRLTEKLKTKHRYYIHLTTASGRVRILQNSEKEFVDKVVAALNRAIVLQN